MTNCSWHADGTLPTSKNAIFVFGSNLNGNHIGGAAKVAVEKFGAVEGIAMGLHRNSYAIATLDEHMKPLTRMNIGQQVDVLFRTYASLGLDENLFITRVGCGIAGFKDEEIAPLFNIFLQFECVSFPDTWKQFLE